MNTYFLLVFWFPLLCFQLKKFYAKFISSSKKIACYKSNVKNLLHNKWVTTLSKSPPFYPNGWHGVCLSDELKVGEIKSVIAVGQELIAYRNDSGEAFIVSSLSADTENKYWDVLEQNHIIFVWYHSRMESPNWFPYKIDSKYIRREVFKEILTSHIQDVIENKADKQHFDAVHGPMFSLSKNWIAQFLAKHCYLDYEHKFYNTSEWYESVLELNVKVILFGLKIGEASMREDCYGPVYTHVTLTFYGINVYFSSVSFLLNKNRLQQMAVFYAETDLKTRIFSRFVYSGISYFFSRDIVILNNRRFTKSPSLTKLDQSVVEYRKWFQQFY